VQRDRGMLLGGWVFFSRSATDSGFFSAFRLLSDQRPAGDFHEAAVLGLTGYALALQGAVWVSWGGS